MCVYVRMCVLARMHERAFFLVMNMYKNMSVFYNICTLPCTLLFTQYQLLPLTYMWPYILFRFILFESLIVVLQNLVPTCNVVVL